MEDEDEVDVLGEFNLENLFSKEDSRLASCCDGGGELLHCDYNIGSQWLLDNTTQPCWYTSSDPAETLTVGSDSWTEKEKALLEKGLVLFGRNWESLSQFLGNKTSQEVRRYMFSQNNFQEPLISDSGALSFAELIDDTQIPASMEEVIAAVSTAQPTVLPVVPRKQQTAHSSSLSTKGTDHLRLRGRRGRPHMKRPTGIRDVHLKKLTVTELPIVSSGEEVVRISKENCLDSDEEIEIEESTVGVINEQSTKLQSTASDDSDENEMKQPEKIIHLPVPTGEVELDPDTITEGEQAYHSEFFEGRSTKTPKRYLKIRNHILECWKRSRPSYVTKTSVRSGLRNCGDVNCIGRIHRYLEQIGAINFGCEQTQYLQSVCTSPSTTQSREKVNKKQQVARQQARIEAMRPRKRKQGCWFPFDGDGGYTITHSDDGEALHTTVVHKTVSHRVRRVKAEPVNLICCSKFNDSKPVPFSVMLRLQALLVMDVHAHSSHSEVTGLLGGRFETGTLHIIQAVPCRSNSSGMHCDMCPVSQAEAMERLRNDGLDVVGWYHSHPTFLPNPSEQDITTQANMQQWFMQATSSPIVGFILSPYCSANHSLASQYRCLTVEMDERIPFRFPVCVVLDDMNLSRFVLHLKDIIALVQENSAVAVDFSAEFQPSQSYLWKCLESTRLHLDSCKENVPQDVRSTILKEVEVACYSLNVRKFQEKDTNDLVDYTEPT
ncbi:histone H2A deubiquitinase MYSM1 [Anabrus simplex]|uniref:histone H2A deubiquitinase MYSM1 n=1 Tax=Anabrus simplex TaxID=316456 RepID=UPI0035A2BA9A